MRHTLHISLTIIAAVSSAAFVNAQPAPSFTVTCGELREAAKALDMKGDPLYTIAVVGTLTIAKSDGALAYMGMCAPPAVQVLCVTYQLGPYKVGDRVKLTGSYIPRGPNHIQLDPCLHGQPE